MVRGSEINVPIAENETPLAAEYRRLTGELASVQPTFVRIFDKKLGSTYGSALGGVNTSRLGVSSIDGLLYSLRQRDGSQGTRAIYLHGYAALFLISVDFPLSAPPKVEAEKVEKDIDPVWQNTKREVSASDKTPEGEYLYVKSDSAKEYDAEKVEDLKTELVKALRHTANIASCVLRISYCVNPLRITQYARLITHDASRTTRNEKSELGLQDFRERVEFAAGGLGPAPAEGI